MRMCSLCRLSVAKNHNFGKILTFGGSRSDPLYRRASNRCTRAGTKSTFIRQISSECVHCIDFRWPKKQFWANFDIWGILYRPPFTDKSQIWWPVQKVIVTQAHLKLIGGHAGSADRAVPALKKTSEVPSVCHWLCSADCQVKWLRTHFCLQRRQSQWHAGTSEVEA